MLHYTLMTCLVGIAFQCSAQQFTSQQFSAFIAARSTLDSLHLTVSEVPGLEESGMSLDRYSEILRMRLSGQEVDLNENDKRALSTIREAITRDEIEMARSSMQVALDKGLTTDAYVLMDSLYRTSAVFREKLVTFQLTRQNRDK